LKVCRLAYFGPSRFKFREGARLKASDAKHTPEPVKMALRTRDKVAAGPEELLKWIRSLNPGLCKEDWTVLDSKDEPIGRRLVLLVDWVSAKIIKITGCKTFTGLSEGTFKVLSETPWQYEGAKSPGDSSLPKTCCRGDTCCTCSGTLGLWGPDKETVQ
jgi:hypothetical protein